LTNASVGTATKALLFTVLASMLFNLLAIPVGLGQPTQLIVVAPTAGIQVPTQFDINITVADVPAEPNALYAWQIKLYYNTTVLTWLNASLPPGHVFDGEPYYSPNAVNDSDVEGTYILMTASLIGDVPRFSGSGILCRLFFEAKAAGASALVFSRPLGWDDPIMARTWLTNYDLTWDMYFTPVEASVTVIGFDPRPQSAISISVSPPSVFASANVTISGAINVTVPDNTQVQIEYRMENMAIWRLLARTYTLGSQYYYVWKTSSEDDGLWDIRARWEGNEAYKAAISETKTVAVTPDFTPPITFSDYDGLWHTTDFTINLNATDDLSGVGEIYYKVNDGANKTVSVDGQPNITTENATNSLEYWSVDNAGNEELPHNILTGIKLDKTAPAVSMISPLNGSEVKSSTLMAQWNASDDTSGIDHYEIKLDGGSWANVGTNTTHTFMELGEGEHTLEIKAVDKVGMTKLDSIRFTVNTSLLLGPGYIEEIIILAITILVVLGIALYFSKIRKH